MIGRGNAELCLQAKGEAKQNGIGERIPSWRNEAVLTGWLDLSSGDSSYAVYDAKIQESTHVFVCGYADLGGVAAEECRAVIDGSRYDVVLVDDPLGMHRQLEIYLKYTGGQDA